MPGTEPSPDNGTSGVVGRARKFLAALKFDFDPFQRDCIVNGLDDIGLALQHETDIALYETGHAAPIATTALPR